MSGNDRQQPRFIVDRMLGTLTRYLRFLGYDTISANSLRLGNRREDTLLIEISRRDRRVLLTKDRELARRGGEDALLITAEDVLDQLAQLVAAGVLNDSLKLKMVRCSLCNARLRPATPAEIARAEYAPRIREGLDFFWCARCRKLYWMGSHARNLSKRLDLMQNAIDKREEG
jgi:uncharacterized protein with PIN domain